MTQDTQKLRRDIDQLIKLSRQQLALAKASDWEQWEQQEPQRQQLLKDTLAGELPAEFANPIAAAIRQIQSIEQEILTLAQEAKLENGKELRQLAKGNKAIKGYQQT